MDESLNVTVEFGPGFAGVDTGPALLECERIIRRMTGRRAEVFLERMGDDSKLRRSLTPADRKKL